MMLAPNRMVSGGSVTLERVGERGEVTRVRSCLDLGPPEALPETRIWCQVVYWEDKVRKPSEEVRRDTNLFRREHY